MAETAAKRIALLEGWVRDALARGRDDDRAVVAACRLITQQMGIEIGSVADKLDWSTRTIHRRFLSACGYSPKHFQRIMRVQRALQLVNRARLSPVRLGELAAAAGYADQAHMTRDFRNITGFTPAGYFASIANPGWGAWISEDW
jgi:transcriptional regulator GlxA family with amidase domain